MAKREREYNRLRMDTGQHRRIVCMMLLFGLLLFLLPLTVSIIDLRYTAPVVCITAMTAALHESRYLLRTRKIPNKSDEIEDKP